MKLGFHFLIILLLCTGLAACKTTDNKPVNLQVAYTDAAGHFERGNKLYDASDYEGAIIEYNTAIAIASQSKKTEMAEYYLKRGQAHKKLFQFPEAIASFQMTTKIQPKNRQAYFLMGETYDLLGWTTKAGEAYAKYNGQAQTTKSNGLNIPDRDDGRFLDLTKPIDLGISTPLLDAEEYIHRGKQKYERRKYQDALHDFIQATKLAPEKNTGYNLLGNAYYQLQKHSLAIKNYSLALEKGAVSEIVYTNRANAYIAIKDSRRAFADLDRAIELNPAYALAYYVRGDAQILARNYYKATKAYGKAIELNPENATTGFKQSRAYFKRGEAYLRHGKLELAIHDFDRTLEQGSDATTFCRRGETYTKLKQYERAIQDFTSALEEDPDYSYARHQRGFAYLRLKRYEAAIADFDIVLEKHPNYRKCIRHRQAALNGLGK